MDAEWQPQTTRDASDTGVPSRKQHKLQVCVNLLMLSASAGLKSVKLFAQRRAPGLLLWGLMILRVGSMAPVVTDDVVSFYDRATITPLPVLSIAVQCTIASLSVTAFTTQKSFDTRDLRGRARYSDG